jgi:hypothetical protein
VKDLGNYDYLAENDVLPVDITGLDDAITIPLGSQLQLSPIIKNVENPERYTYIWFAIETQVSGLPAKHILGTAKDLDVKILLDAGNYLLNFEVIDEKKDIYKRKQISMNIVASDINAGWYVLKDKNNETDFDYVNADGTLYPDVLAVSGNRLKGKAVCMAYQSGRYYHPVTGSMGETVVLNNQQAFHVMSDEDIRTFNARNLSLFKTYKDEFYLLPSKCELQCVFYPGSWWSGHIYIMNAGKLHAINGMSSNLGKFGAPKVGNYSLFPVILPFNYSSDVLVFDTKTHTFYASSTSGTSLNEIKDQQIGSEHVSLKNMPYSMVNMFTGKATNPQQQSFALMKNTSDGSYRIAQIPFSSDAVFSNFNKVPDDAMLVRSSVMACAASGNFVYFAIDNTVYYYMNAADLETKEKALVRLPSDETIMYMKYAHIGETPALAVLSNVSTNWKLYIYPIEAVGNPELKSEPSAIYTGQGTGRYLMYREE